MFQAACFVLLMFSVNCVAAEPLPTLDSATDRKAVEERISAAKKQAKQSKSGRVIIGQVVVEEGDDSQMVMTQMLILKGGYFAGPVKSKVGSVGFTMHQYAPFDLTIGEKEGEVIDVGVITMRRLPEQDLVPLKGKVLLEGNVDPRKATVTCSVMQGAVNTPSNGTEPRPNWPKPIEVAIGETGLVESKIFSPVSYYVTISADGYVSQSHRLEFKPGIGADFHDVKLEKPRQVSIEYLISKKDDFDLSELKTEVIKGGERWKATPDIYGWDLEFKQKGGRLYFDFSYAPCTIEDLGEMGMEELLETGKASKTVLRKNSVIQDGHVYFVEQSHWKRNILLRATLLKSE